jgi:hypothetical protein
MMKNENRARLLSDNFESTTKWVFLSSPHSILKRIQILLMSVLVARHGRTLIAIGVPYLSSHTRKLNPTRPTPPPSCSFTFIICILEALMLVLRNTSQSPLASAKHTSTPLLPQQCPRACGVHSARSLSCKAPA